MFAALLPTVLSKDQKPALSSSILTATVLTSFAIAFFTIDFLGSALSAAAVATEWWILAYQRWQLNRKKSQE